MLAGILRTLAAAAVKAQLREDPAGGKLPLGATPLQRSSPFDVQRLDADSVPPPSQITLDSAYVNGIIRGFMVLCDLIGSCLTTLD